MRFEHILYFPLIFFSALKIIILDAERGAEKQGEKHLAKKCASVSKEKNITVSKDTLILKNFTAITFGSGRCLRASARYGEAERKSLSFLIAETVSRGIRENAEQMAANRISSQVKNADFIGSEIADVTVMQRKGRRCKRFITRQRGE